MTKVAEKSEGAVVKGEPGYVRLVTKSVYYTQSPTACGLTTLLLMPFQNYSVGPSPLMRYIMHRLYAGQTMEISVLRELVWKIEPLHSKPCIT